LSDSLNWSQPQGSVFLEPELQFSTCHCNAPKTQRLPREGTRGSLCWKEYLLGLSVNTCRKLVPLIRALKYVAAQKRHFPAAYKEKDSHNTGLKKWEGSKEVGKPDKELVCRICGQGKAWDFEPSELRIVRPPKNVSTKGHFQILGHVPGGVGLDQT
jgi:hypothetical protein